MKAGFWVAPEGADSPIAIMPIGVPDDRTTGVTGAGALAFLATTDAEAMVARCPGVAALLPRLLDALERQTAAGAGILFDLAELTAEERLLVGEVFGQGEVSAVVALPEGVTAQVQESTMAGLWRVRFTNGHGVLVADYAEVSSVPQVIRRAADMTLPAVTLGLAPQGAMNAMPVLVEIRDRAKRHQPGDETHTISLSLLPMTQEDIDFVQSTLGTGPVRIVSRGYGTCHVQATALHNVWSVQFFNATDTILLDTIEIGDVPVVACAAVEDFQDSAERLRDIDAAYFR